MGDLNKQLGEDQQLMSSVCCNLELGDVFRKKIRSTRRQQPRQEEKRNWAAH